MMAEDVVSRQHKMTGAQSKKQSNYESNFENRRNIKRTLNNLKTYSSKSLVDQQHIVQNAKNKFNEDHNIMDRKQTQHLLSKNYFDTINETKSLSRNLKFACYENISIKSKMTNQSEKTSLDLKEIKRNLYTYSKNYSSEEILPNKYKAIFYKDLCISGKNMSMWKRIKCRLRSLTSAKIKSDTYFVSTDLSRTLSTCDYKKSHDLSGHSKIKSNFEATKDTPYSKNYITMHLKVERSNTSQELINNNIKVFSKLKGTPCMFYETKCMKLPVVNFPESCISDYKKSIKAIVKTKISVIIKQLLAKLLDECNTQCDEINTRSCRTTSAENISLSVRKSKSVAADTDCKDKSIPNRNETKATIELSILKRRNKTTSLQSINKKLCIVNTTTNSLSTNKSRQSQVPKCKQLSKNNQGISIKCKCAKTMGKVKCSNVNTTTLDKKYKASGNVRRHNVSKCVKTQCLDASKDYTNQFSKKQHEKCCGSQYTKPNKKKSKTKCRKAVKRKSNENLNCNNKEIEKNLHLDDKEKPVSHKHAKTQISSFSKHSNNTLIYQKNTHNPCECQQIYPNPITKSSKKTNFRKIFKLKSKEKLINNRSTDQSPILSKHHEYTLTRRKSCSSFASKQIKKYFRHREIKGKLNMKNTYSPSKNIRSDMDIRCKDSDTRHDCCNRSCCRCDKDYLNSRAMCAFEAQVGDCTSNLICNSSNSQMTPRLQHCPTPRLQQSTFRSDHLLTEKPHNRAKWSSKRQLHHDRIRTIPQNQYCKSCFTALTSNSQPKSLELRVTPRICTCTKNLNKTFHHKPKTTCIRKEECQKKIQTCPNFQSCSNRNRNILVGFFENLTNWYRIKRCKQVKSSRRKKAFQVHYSLTKLYEYAFGDRSYPAFNCMCPVITHNSSNRGFTWRQCSNILGLLCMFCFWCPLLVLFRMCGWL